MDPYAKALRISLGLHTAVALALVVSIFFGEVFRPRPAAVFTVMAPPAGLIAGGPASTPAAAALPEVLPLPQGPKLPSPAQQERPTPPKPAPAEIAPKPAAKAPPRPQRKSDSGVLPRSKPTPRPKEKPAEKLSFSEFQKKYGAKETSKAKPAPTTSRVAPAGAPSFEENLSSRLNRRLQEEGERTVGTGLGGAPGSGIAGNGTPGATMDAEALYTGTLYTYLNSVWEEPREVGGTRLMARVEFVVNRAGQITSWRITRGSGSPSFDKSVEKVFQRVKEVSPPPTAQDYRLSVNFETREQ